MSNKYSFSTKVEVKMPKSKANYGELRLGLAVQDAISTGIREASEKVERKLRRSLHASMRSLWPYRDERRDIIDTGKLKRSLQTSTVTKGSGFVTTITYPMPYAKLIYYGGVIKPYGNKNAADVIIPGRPWVQAIMEGTYGQEKFDPAPIVKRSIRKAWNQKFR